MPKKNNKPQDFHEEAFITSAVDEAEPDDDSFYTEETLKVYKYLTIAGNEEDPKKSIAYIKKALKIDPENLDAQFALISMTSEHSWEILSALKDLTEKGHQQMVNAGYYPDSYGDFWKIHQTRPYMRVLDGYANALYMAGKLSKAAEVFKQMFDLCDTDDLMARFKLMHIYASLEDEAQAIALMEELGDDNETEILLPLTLLYFKLDKLDQAEIYLRRLTEANKDTKKFFKALENDEMDKYFDSLDSEKSRPIDDFIFLFAEHEQLYFNSGDFIIWVNQVLKKKGQKKG